jgi:hypothetical protein
MPIAEIFLDRYYTVALIFLVIYSRHPLRFRHRGENPVTITSFYSITSVVASSTTPLFSSLKKRGCRRGNMLSD